MIAKLLGDFWFISKLPESLQAAVEISFIEAYRFIPSESKLDYFAKKDKLLILISLLRDTNKHSRNFGLFF